ncbi:hypothetical protein PV327_005980 [Microctonus hyperodae]|uniref:Condensin complex subunit 1 n=1 Tax=Microctonus hyperodae TaxID=165561 RepID=A0AA39L0B2_MICHY|nr:hypothetical protein PV327_005980 [Microctonus hyperodae]
MEFTIPLDKDDLLQINDGQYHVKELISQRCIPKALDDTKVTLQAEGPAFILKHFDDFFSIIVHGQKLETIITARAFDRLIKAFQLLVNNFEENGLENDRQKNLCMTKMFIYLLSNIMCYLENATISLENNLGVEKRKKKTAKKSDARDEWESRRDAALLIIYRLLQLPLHKLWQPPIVEESFIMLIADICYKILENDKEIRQKQTRLVIWQILGTLVQRYIHAITCAIKIIQLVRMDDALAPILADGVVTMVKENNCPSFIAKIAHEIEENNLEEAEARNVSSFLEAIASTSVDLMLPILNNILEYLENDCYVLRNCGISIIGNIILGLLTGENLTKDQKEKRDECLDELESCMLDINTYVRSKAFQTWQKLCCEGAIPIARIPALLKAVTPHLLEKSATMRKQALQLLRVFLQSNPYHIALGKEIYIKERDLTEEKLHELESEVVAESASGDDTRIALWKELAPQLQKVLNRYLNENDEDGDKENRADENAEIDSDVEFEKIRQLLVDRKFTKAIKCLINMCEILNFVPDMESDAKEQCYLLFLLKIFLESEKSRQTDKQKFTSTEWKKRKVNIQTYKHAINSLEGCIIFIDELEKSIPVVESMLYAAAPAVAIEACTFLGVAYEFNVTGATAGIRKSLSQVFSRDESVRNNVAIVYKDIYLKSKQQNLSHRQVAMASVNGLIELFKGLEPGQSPALAQLISIFIASNDLNETTLQIMWEKYSAKIPGTTPDESRAAIALLSMVSQSQPKIIISNLSTLIKIGFQTQGKDNILLARDTCRVLMNIRTESSDSMVPPIKYPNDHDLIREVKTLLITNFEASEKMSYVSFATEAINVIYHLANQPQLIMKEILQQILGESADVDVPITHLSKLLYVIGHIAIRHMVHLDTAVYKELKRRNAIRDERKGKKNVNKDKRESIMSAHSSARKARHSMHRRNMSYQDEDEENQLAGATADDVDAEIIDQLLETNIVTGDGLLAQFVSLVKDVCQHPEKYNDQCTQTWGVLALSKMMTVSSEFCKQNLQLLITILERSTHPAIRSNILIGLSDLMMRFPNDVEPWTNHMYSRLQDKEITVRSTAVQVLSHLVKREMIRVKGQSAELTLCIVDSDAKIRNTAKQFFHELSQKGNVLYNVIPDILSRLTSPNINVEQDDLHIIFKYIFGLLHKERETDALLDKICARFKLATSERQWSDLSFCLSLLQLGKKGITRLVTNLPLLKDKIHNKQVQKALKDIIETARKKPDLKDVSNVLENEIEKLMDGADNDNENAEKDNDRDIMPPPMNPPVRKTSRRKTQRKSNSSEEEEEEEDEDDNNDNDDDDDDDEEPPRPTPKTKARSKKRANDTKTPVRKSMRLNDGSRNNRNSTDSESETPRRRR